MNTAGAKTAIMVRMPKLTMPAAMAAVVLTRNTGIKKKNLNIFQEMLNTDLIMPNGFAMIAAIQPMKAMGMSM